MKRSEASCTGRADVRLHAKSSYETSHQGGLNILEKSRPTAGWSRVSPAVLGEIDQYVHALARR